MCRFSLMCSLVCDERMQKSLNTVNHATDLHTDDEPIFVRCPRWTVAALTVGHRPRNKGNLLSRCACRQQGAHGVGSWRRSGRHVLVSAARQHGCAATIARHGGCCYLILSACACCHNCTNSVVLRSACRNFMGSALAVATAVTDHITRVGACLQTVFPCHASAAIGIHVCEETVRTTQFEQKVHVLPRYFFPYVAIDQPSLSSALQTIYFCSLYVVNTRTVTHLQPLHIVSVCSEQGCIT